MPKQIDLSTELAAAIEATEQDRAQFQWIVWCLAMLERGERRDALERVIARVGEVESNNVTLGEWATFIVDGLPGLRELTSSTALERHHIALWSAAWAWQCATNLHEDPKRDGLHVGTGAGGGRILCMQWDTERDGFSRHVVLAKGALSVGQFNTHAALEGWPGLPEHLVDAGYGHIAVEASE